MGSTSASSLRQRAASASLRHTSQHTPHSRCAVASHPHISHLLRLPGTYHLPVQQFSHHVISSIKCVLQGCNWYRHGLDAAQNVRDPRASTSCKASANKSAKCDATKVVAYLVPGIYLFIPKSRIKIFLESIFQGI